MYTLEKNLDFTFMLEKELIQICVGSYQVLLHFSEDLTITIESNYRLITSEEDINLEADNPKDAARLFPLLGKKIKHVESVEKNEIRLQFSDETILALCGEDEGMESYAITMRDKEIII